MHPQCGFCAYSEFPMYRDTLQPHRPKRFAGNMIGVLAVPIPVMGFSVGGIRLIA